MKSLPTIKQMQYLVALAEHKHFGRAAEASHVTQSTLSAGIRELEQLLGVQLAERTKRSVLMTRLGDELAQMAQGILQQAEDIMHLAKAGRDPLSGELRLGVIPTIGPYLLPKILPLLRAQFPTLKLFLREEKSDDLLEKLDRGQLDAAIIALPYDIANLTSRELFFDAFQLAVPKAHALAERQTISHADLLGQTLMLLEDGHCLRGHALSACQLEERKQGAAFEATSLHTLVQMVAAGLGVTLLPQMAIDAHIARDTDIALIPFASNGATRHIGLVWRKSSTRKAEFELFATEISRHAGTTKAPA